VFAVTATLEQFEHDPTILRRAMELGETVQILQNGEVAGNFTPVPRPAPAQPERWPGIGLYKGRITMAPNFDEPLEEFREYTE